MLAITSLGATTSAVTIVPRAPALRSRVVSVLTSHPDEVAYRSEWPGLAARTFAAPVALKGHSLIE